MTNEEYIKQKLADNKAAFKEIAFKTNITERTLQNIVTNAHVPNAQTVTILTNYFKRRERK